MKLQKEMKTQRFKLDSYSIKVYSSFDNIKIVDIAINNMWMTVIRYGNKYVDKGFPSKLRRKVRNTFENGDKLEVLYGEDKYEVKLTKRNKDCVLIKKIA